MKRKRRSFSEKFKEQLEYDVFSRPHFAYGIYFVALQAKAFGIKGISVYKFGVGWGGDVA